MGVNAEGRISLSIEIENLKQVASNLKKSLSAEMKQVSLDVEFDDKKIEEKAVASLQNINKMLSRGKMRELDFSSLIPSFTSKLNEAGLSDEVRVEIIKGFESALNNLKKYTLKENFNTLKLFNGEELKIYLQDLNNIVDTINAIPKLTNRQREGLIKTGRPANNEMPITGVESEAYKTGEYSKGAKKIQGILKLKEDYSDVLQYATSPTETGRLIGEIEKMMKSGSVDFLKKTDAKDLLGYILRSQFLNAKIPKEDLDYMMGEIQEALDEETIKLVTERTTAYFQALDDIYNSSNSAINYSDLVKDIANTTNKSFAGEYDVEAAKTLTEKGLREAVTKIKHDQVTKETKKKAISGSSKKVEDEASQKQEVQETLSQYEEVVSDYKGDITKLQEDILKIEEQYNNASDKEQVLRKELKEDQKLLDDLNAKVNDKQKYYDQISTTRKSQLKSAELQKDTQLYQLDEINKKIEQIKTQKESLESKLKELKKEQEGFADIIKENAPILLQQTNEIEEQQKALNENIGKNENALDIQNQWLEYYDAALKKDYSTKGKKEATDQLRKISNRYLHFRQKPEDFAAFTDKQSVEDKLIVQHYEAYQEAIKQGVAQSTLNRFQFDSDYEDIYKDALQRLQTDRAKTQELFDTIKKEIDDTKMQIAALEKKKKELKDQLELNNEKITNTDNQKKANVQIEELDKKLEDLEKQKIEKEKQLAITEGEVKKRSQPSALEKHAAQELQQVQEQRDAQKAVFDEKTQMHNEALEQANALDKQLYALQDKEEELIKAKEELKQKQEEEANTFVQTSVSQKTDTSIGGGNTTETNQGNGQAITGISPENLQQILDLLGKIQVALGTLDDNSDAPSIVQSIREMISTLTDLKGALDIIKEKDFNLNIGLNNANPIAQQGEAKRKILKELEQQYDELNNYFAEKYGGDAEAINSLHQLEGGSSYIQSLMDDLPVAQNPNESLISRIDAYKNLVDHLRYFVTQEGGDLNNIVSNVLSPDKIIDTINNEVAQANPVSAISNIFEGMKTSIEASLVQLSIESKGFEFLSGSAEEAAEAKRKFVEANREVLESIVSSMPKIQDEANALSSMGTEGNIKDNIIENIVEPLKEGMDTYDEYYEQAAKQKQERLDSYITYDPKKEEANTSNEVQIEKEKNEELIRIQEARKQALEQYEKEQQEIRDMYFEKAIEDMQQEYAESQQPAKITYDFELDYEDIERQAEEARQHFQEQIFNDFEIKTEASFNLVEDSTGQLSLFEGIEEAANWGQQLNNNLDDISRKDFSNIKGQLSFEDMEKAAKQLEESTKQLETSYKKLSNQKDYIQGEDVSEKFLEKYEDIPSTAKTEELFQTIQKLKQVKIELDNSFDKSGKLIGDPEKTSELYNSYLQLTEAVKKLKLEISGAYSEETYLLQIKQNAADAEKNVNSLTAALEKNFTKLSSSKEFIQGKDLGKEYIGKYGIFGDLDNLSKLSEFYSQLENVKTELSSSFDSNNKLIGDPQKVEELFNKYYSLTEQIKKLKLVIESPNSEENIALQFLRDEQKAENETKNFIKLLEKTYSKLSNSKEYMNIDSSVVKMVEPYYDLSMEDAPIANQILDALTDINQVKADLASSFDSRGNLIGDPDVVQNLLELYKALILSIKQLKIMLDAPDSKENIALKMLKDAEKASKEFDVLYEKVERAKNSYGIQATTAENFLNKYLQKDAEGQVLPEQDEDHKIGNTHEVLELKKAIEEFHSAYQDLLREFEKDKTDVDHDVFKEKAKNVEDLKQKIKDLQKIIRSSGDSIANPVNTSKLASQIEVFLARNPRLSAEAKAGLQGYLNVLNSGGTVATSTLREMSAGFEKFKADEETAGRTGLNIWGQMIAKMREGVAFLATKFSFYQIFNQFRQGIQIIHEFDDALTEMQKVSDETISSLQRYQKTTFAVADAIGSSALQIQQSTADFMRLGETLEEAAKSAQAANILMNVSEFENINEATESLIAMGAAYKDLTKMDIIDKLNEVGNNYAISTSEAAQALQSSASALTTAGNDMDEALALVTAGNTVVQDANKVGIKNAQR